MAARILLILVLVSWSFCSFKRCSHFLASRTSQGFCCSVRNLSASCCFENDVLSAKDNNIFSLPPQVCPIFSASIPPTTPATVNHNCTYHDVGLVDDAQVYINATKAIQEVVHHLPTDLEHSTDCTWEEQNNALSILMDVAGRATTSATPLTSSTCIWDWQCKIVLNRYPHYFWEVDMQETFQECVADGQQGTCQTYLTSGSIIRQIGCRADGSPVYYQGTTATITGVSCVPVE